ncbi:MAG: S41 family peptidase [Candidatus Hydrogenedentes bacterium]|nr:S41 family peptidase [Candidatus Hydrogenedentota bacterium]
MRNCRSQFLALFLFLAAAFLVLTNGFTARIAAQGNEVDVISEIAPIGEVLDEILRNYVREPDTAHVVEGALIGMMNALDEHSSYISAEFYQEMTEETSGEFEGIGISIHLDEQKNIAVHHPIPGSPACRAGILGGDIIFKIDGVATKGMSLDEAADRIRGPRGTIVTLSVLRSFENPDLAPELLDIEVKRGKIPLESIAEFRLLEGGIGYIRVTDFKKPTADEIAGHIATLEEQGMKSLVLDLRWNPGGLLTSSQEVCSLFLPRNTLVTYTKARDLSSGDLTEDMRLFTDREPVLAPSVPIILLVNEHTASSSEIVTGALQFWRRAIVVGTKTYGKGSVQTLIELHRPAGAALRLTTGLYYTPADVTIDNEGIKPDVEAPMALEQWARLLQQMRDSYVDDPAMQNQQNHGAATGNEKTSTTIDDVQLMRAIEILNEDQLFENLLEKYHKDTSETQVAAAESSKEAVH